MPFRITSKEGIAGAISSTRSIEMTRLLTSFDVNGCELLLESDDDVGTNIESINIKLYEKPSACKNLPSEKFDNTMYYQLSASLLSRGAYPRSVYSVVTFNLDEPKTLAQLMEINWFRGLNQSHVLGNFMAGVDHLRLALQADTDKNISRVEWYSLGQEATNMLFQFLVDQAILPRETFHQQNYPRLYQSISQAEVRPPSCCCSVM